MPIRLIPINSSRNSKCRIAVKSDVFDSVAPGSPASSTSTDELRGAPSAKRQEVAPQPRASYSRSSPARSVAESHRAPTSANCFCACTLTIHDSITKNARPASTQVETSVFGYCRPQVSRVCKLRKFIRLSKLASVQVGRRCSGAARYSLSWIKRLSCTGVVWSNTVLDSRSAPRLESPVPELVPL